MTSQIRPHTSNQKTFYKRGATLNQASSQAPYFAQKCLFVNYSIVMVMKLILILSGVSPSVAMRRMTVVSPYPHWHYFDAYGQHKLKAVYRGNGIPLPWGNMRQVNDPRQHWAVFRRLSQPQHSSSAQISILDVNEEPRIYCCESVNIADRQEQQSALVSI